MEAIKLEDKEKGGAINARSLSASDDNFNFDGVQYLIFVAVFIIALAIIKDAGN